MNGCASMRWVGAWAFWAATVAFAQTPDYDVATENGKILATVLDRGVKREMPGQTIRGDARMKVQVTGTDGPVPAWDQLTAAALGDYTRLQGVVRAPEAPPSWVVPGVGVVVSLQVDVPAEVVVAQEPAEVPEANLWDEVLRERDGGSRRPFPSAALVVTNEDRIEAVKRSVRRLVAEHGRRLEGLADDEQVAVMVTVTSKPGSHLRLEWATAVLLAQAHSRLPSATPLFRGSFVARIGDLREAGEDVERALSCVKFRAW